MNTLSRTLSMALVCALALYYSSYGYSTPKPEFTPPESSEYIELKNTFFDSVKIFKKATTGAKTKVFIEKTSVEFSKHWERTFKARISKRYKERTLNKYSKALEQILIQASENSSKFQLVSKADDAELILRAHLSRLNIYGPDDFMGKSMVYRAGNARFELIVEDASSGEPLIKFIDSRETTDRGYRRPIEANRGTNLRDFKMLMRLWSKKSFEFMENQPAA